MKTRFQVIELNVRSQQYNTNLCQFKYELFFYPCFFLFDYMCQCSLKVTFVALKFKVGKTTLSSTFLMRIRFQGYRDESGMSFRSFQIARTVSLISQIILTPLKGVLAKNERGYRRNAKNKRFRSLLILLLSVASIRRKLLKKIHTEERSAHTNSESCNIQLGS